MFKTALLNLVDLAGSERQRDTQAAGVRLKVVFLSLQHCPLPLPFLSFLSSPSLSPFFPLSFLLLHSPLPSLSYTLPFLPSPFPPLSPLSPPLPPFLPSPYSILSFSPFPPSLPLSSLTSLYHSTLSRHFSLPPSFLSQEAGSINKSLSALGNVIMALVDITHGKSRHVHYRDSKLTFLLRVC